MGHQKASFFHSFCYFLPKNHLFPLKITLYHHKNGCHIRGGGDNDFLKKYTPLVFALYSGILCLILS